MIPQFAGWKSADRRNALRASERASKRVPSSLMIIPATAAVPDTISRPSAMVGDGHHQPGARDGLGGEGLDRLRRAGGREGEAVAPRAAKAVLLMASKAVMAKAPGLDPAPRASDA